MLLKGIDVVDAGGGVEMTAGGPVRAWGWPSEISEMAFMVIVWERAWVLKRAKRLVLYMVLVESCMVVVASWASIVEGCLIWTCDD